MMPLVSKYGSPVRLDAQIVALRAYCAKGAPIGIKTDHPGEFVNACQHSLECSRFGATIATLSTKTKNCTVGTLTRALYEKVHKLIQNWRVTEGIPPWFQIFVQKTQHCNLLWA